jgi:hypothetical protein
VLCRSSRIHAEEQIFTDQFELAEDPSCELPIGGKVGYPTTEQGLFTGQPRKFKYKKAVSIESTTRQDSTGPSCSYTICVLSKLIELSVKCSKLGIEWLKWGEYTIK